MRMECGGWQREPCRGTRAPWTRPQPALKRPPMPAKLQTSQRRDGEVDGMCLSACVCVCVCEFPMRGIVAW